MDNKHCYVGRGDATDVMYKGCIAEANPWLSSYIQVKIAKQINKTGSG